MNATSERAKARHSEPNLAGGLLNLESGFLWRDRGRSGELNDLYLGAVSRNEVVRGRATARDFVAGQSEPAWLSACLPFKPLSHTSPLPRLLPENRIPITHKPPAPQATTLPRGQSKIHCKVLMILAVPAVLLGGLLLRASLDPREPSNAGHGAIAADTGYAGATGSNPESMPPVGGAARSNDPMATRQPVGQQPASSPSALPTPPPPAATPAAKSALTARSSEYVLAPRDTLGAIARKQHVSLNALLEANPGVDARKLRIGQKLQIPTAPIAVAVAASAESPGGDAPAYVAKTGDPLNKPAKIRGPSSVELMAMNDLKTPTLRADQKLKISSP